MTATKPVYLASDVHLGATHPEQARAFLAWLGHAAERASQIVLNGDLFDFWFEYRRGVTRGHDVTLSALRDIVASGVPVTLMGGNHDWWGGPHLRNEVGLEFLEGPVVRELGGRTTFLAHGDGLGNGDTGYRLLRPLLRSRLTTWAFATLPPSLGDRLAGGVSVTETRWTEPSRKQRARSKALEAWATRELARRPELDLIVLGHTHVPLVRPVGGSRWYVNAGDWVFHRSYLVLETDCEPRLMEWTGKP